MSERTFRRYRDRFEAEGADGLYDRRLGRASARRAGVDEVMAVLELFDTRYFDFTAKHFCEKLVAEHGVTRSYNWVRLTLQAHGRVRSAPRRGAHRRKRPRRPMAGMLLHQDGSRHAWVPGQWWDLIVTMDDATSEVYSGFFVAEEGTISTFRALDEVIAANGLFCSLYAECRPGLALLAYAGGRGQGRQEQPDPGRTRARPARHRADRGLLAETFWPVHNARFASPAEEAATAFVPFAGDLEDVLCVQHERVVAGDNTVRYNGRTLQIPADRHRHHYVKATVRVQEYPDGDLAVFHGPRCLARYDGDGNEIDNQGRRAA